MHKKFIYLHELIMIAKTLRTINGKIVVKIPTLLSEVSLGMLINLQGPTKSDLETISILSGTDKDELLNVCNINDLKEFDEHIASLIHKIKYECDDLPVPKTIVIDGKTVKVSSNLSIEPVGAFMECRNIIADEINEHIKLYGEEDWKRNFQPSLEATTSIIANYLYCHATGLPYNDEKVEELKPLVLLQPISVIIPIGRYFFLRYPHLWKEKQGYSRALLQLWKRKLELRRSRYSRT